MLTIDPQHTLPADMYKYLLGMVAPRPIALVSTVDEEESANLSPFSYFNVFSINPPIIVFSPSRRGKNNTTKDTYDNILVTREAVVNTVSYAMVQQVSLASTEYPKGVNEFDKSGLTPVPSTLVSPPRVGEALSAMECKVEKIIPLGNQGGAGTLVVCRVVLAHIQKKVLDDKGFPDPHLMDTVARLGGDFYCRAAGTSLFEVPKPVRGRGIGVDALPKDIKNSDVLTGNDLGILANVATLPDLEACIAYCRVNHIALSNVLEVHRLAQQLLREKKTEEAWHVLLGAKGAIGIC